jgi:hypothetical protein
LNPSSDFLVSKFPFKFNLMYQRYIQALMRAAAERRADILVVGTRALSPLRRAFIGGTAKWCADHAPCAVVAVPAAVLDAFLASSSGGSFDTTTTTSSASVSATTASA